MKLIDIGVNLMGSAFDKDREEVIRSAAEGGVGPLIVTASGEESSLRGLGYAREYNKCYPGALYVTAGVHPHEAKRVDDGTMGRLRELVREGGDLVRAIGECGLDYDRDFSTRDAQRRALTMQADLAAELSLPLFLHERSAFEDFSRIIADYAKAVPCMVAPPMVVHCFTGTGEELDYYLSLGCYIGITGWICDERRGLHLKDLVKRIPLDRLMLETDSPYLLPRDLPFKVKSRRNEPRFLGHIAGVVAECLNMETEELARRSYENSRAFFGI